MGSCVTGAVGGTLGSLAPVNVGDAEGVDIFSVSDYGNLGCGADKIGI